MNSLLSPSTAANALATTPSRKLFSVNSGGYASRLVALYAASPTELRLTFSDPPHTAWSTPITVASDASDSSFDAVISDDATIWLAYTTNTNALVTKKLTFSGGTWSVGPAVTVYSAEPSHNPSIVRESSGKLWISWSRLVTPNRIIHVKSSADNGTTWGAGSADPGEALTSPTMFAWSKLIISLDSIHLIATYGNSKIVIRSRPITGSTWSDEFILASAASGFMDAFDAALGPDGMLAVAWSDTQLRFREFDSLAWGAVVTISTQPQLSPQVFYRNGIPVVVWLENYAGYQKKMLYSERRTGIFTEPKLLDSRYKEFDTVFLFNASAATYSNLTTASQSATTADIFHPASGCLLKSIGDALYLGMDLRFRYAHFELSTPGASGTVSYSYWDGATWQTFTPASGTSHLDSSLIRLHFWNDHNSIPLDWQNRTVAGQTRFWIRCEVTSPYTTGPIGTRITAIPETHQLIVRR